MKRSVKSMPKSATPPANPLVVAVAYDGLCTFEFGCAVEVFALPRPEMGPGWYRFATAAAEPGPLRAAGGITGVANGGLELLARAGTIIVPGWRGPEAPVPEALCGALRAAHAGGARVLSLCSGAFVLAAAGLLRAGARRRTGATSNRSPPAIRISPLFPTCSTWTRGRCSPRPEVPRGSTFSSTWSGVTGGRGSPMPSHVACRAGAPRWWPGAMRRAHRAARPGQRRTSRGLAGSGAGSAGRCVVHPAHGCGGSGQPSRATPPLPGGDGDKSGCLAAGGAARPCAGTPRGECPDRGGGHRRLRLRYIGDAPPPFPARPRHEPGHLPGAVHHGAEYLTSAHPGGYAVASMKSCCGLLTTIKVSPARSR